MLVLVAFGGTFDIEGCADPGKLERVWELPPSKAKVYSSYLPLFAPTRTMWKYVSYLFQCITYQMIINYP